MKIVEFATSVDSDKVAHNEPSHLDLRCLLSILLHYQYDMFDVNFVIFALMPDAGFCGELCWLFQQTKIL